MFQNLSCSKTCIVFQNLSCSKTCIVFQNKTYKSIKCLRYLVSQTFVVEHYRYMPLREDPINPFMPTVAFNICCPRDAVSRTANIERNGGQKWVNCTASQRWSFGIVIIVTVTIVTDWNLLGWELLELEDVPVNFSGVVGAVGVFEWELSIWELPGESYMNESYPLTDEWKNNWQIIRKAIKFLTMLNKNILPRPGIEPGTFRSSV